MIIGPGYWQCVFFPFSDFFCSGHGWVIRVFFFSGHALFHQGCLLPEGGFTTRAPGANNRGCSVDQEETRGIFNTSNILSAREPQIHHAHVHNSLTYLSVYRKSIYIIKS